METPTGLPVYRKVYEPYRPVTTGEPIRRLHRGAAYGHESGDIFQIVGLIYPYPVGPTPKPLVGVILKRTRDNRHVEKKAEVIWEQIDTGKLRLVERWNDNRQNCIQRIEGDRLILETID